MSLPEPLPSPRRHGRCRPSASASPLREGSEEAPWRGLPRQARLPQLQSVAAEEAALLRSPHAVLLRLLRPPLPRRPPSLRVLHHPGGRRRVPVAHRRVQRGTARTGESHLALLPQGCQPAPSTSTSLSFRPRPLAPQRRRSHPLTCNRQPSQSRLLAGEDSRGQRELPTLSSCPSSHRPGRGGAALSLLPTAKSEPVFPFPDRCSAVFRLHSSSLPPPVEDESRAPPRPAPRSHPPSPLPFAPPSLRHRGGDGGRQGGAQPLPPRLPLSPRPRRPSSSWTAPSSRTAATH